MSLALVPGQTAQTVTPSGAPATVNGVLQPPPDIKSIVDKTAQFVARNGPEFEQRILCVMLNAQSLSPTPDAQSSPYRVPAAFTCGTQHTVSRRVYCRCACPDPLYSQLGSRHAVAKATPITMCTRE